MAIEQLRNKIERLDYSVAGVAGAYSASNISIQGRVIKIALVSGATTMLSGNVAITDTTTGESIWTQGSVNIYASNAVRYPRVSGHTSAGAVSGQAADNELGFPATAINVALTGIAPVTGTAKLYIWMQ